VFYHESFTKLIRTGALSPAEHAALAAFYSSLPNAEPILPRFVSRWGRLQISTEQTARSHWKEVVRTSNAARTDRNLKVPGPTSNIISVQILTFIDVGCLSRRHSHPRSKILLSCCRSWKSRDPRAMLTLFPRRRTTSPGIQRCTQRV